MWKYNIYESSRESLKVYSDIKCLHVHCYYNQYFDLINYNTITVYSEDEDNSFLVTLHKAEFSEFGQNIYSALNRFTGQYVAETR